MEMIFFVIIIIFCLFGIICYDRLLTDKSDSGYETKAVILSKTVVRETLPPHGTRVTRYLFSAYFTDEKNNVRTVVFSTERRAARRIEESDMVEIVVINDDTVMLKGDMPTLGGKYFLIAVMCINIVLLITDIAAYLA